MLDDIIELALDVVGELTEAAFSSGTGRTRREKTMKATPKRSVKREKGRKEDPWDWKEGTPPWEK